MGGFHCAFDHILPEHLLNDWDQLQRILAQFGLPTDFDLNSFENWLPAYGPCNRKKRGHVFRPTPIIQLYLDRARDRAPVARKEVEKTRSDQEIGKALAILTTGSQRQLFGPALTLRSSKS